MGQYRQWLHYREVDRHLQARLEQLEQELAQLEEQAHSLITTSPLIENVIIQALLQQCSAAEHFVQTGNLDYASEVPQMPPDFPSNNGALTEYFFTVSSSSSESTAADTSPHGVVSVNDQSNEHLDTLLTEQIDGDTRPEKAVAALDAQEHATPFISTTFFARSNLPNFVSGELPIIDLFASAEAVPTTSHPANDLLPKDVLAFIDGHAQANLSCQQPSKQNDAPTPPHSNASQNPVDQQSLRTDRSIQRWVERWNRPSNTQQEQPTDPKQQQQEQQKKNE